MSLGFFESKNYPTLEGISTSVFPRYSVMRASFSTCIGLEFYFKLGQSLCLSHSVYWIFLFCSCFWTSLDLNVFFFFLTSSCQHLALSYPFQECFNSAVGFLCVWGVCSASPYQWIETPFYLLIGFMLLYYNTFMYFIFIPWLKVETQEYLCQKHSQPVISCSTKDKIIRGEYGKELKKASHKSMPKRKKKTHIRVSSLNRIYEQK